MPQLPADPGGRWWLALGEDALPAGEQWLAPAEAASSGMPRTSSSSTGRSRDSEQRVMNPAAERASVQA